MRKLEVGSILGGLLSLLIVGAIGYGLWFWYHSKTNHHDVTFTVNKTERVVGAEGKRSRYMIYTDRGVYQNTDSLVNLKFNSADLYNQLQAGKKYACDAVGYRIEYFSMFENLIRCSEVK